MKAETKANLEQEVAIIGMELERTRSELKDLKLRQLRSARSTRLRNVGVIVAIILLVGISSSLHSTAQNIPPSTAVSRLEVPVIIADKAGHTIAEISDQTGRRGLTLYSSSGEAVYLGWDKQGSGLLQLLAPGRKLFADVSADGFKFFGTSGQSVAFLGADNNNNGALQLKNAAGGVLVDVGAIDANTGYAQVYPRSGKAPFPIPNYLKGSK